MATLMENPLYLELRERAKKVWTGLKPDREKEFDAIWGRVEGPVFFLVKWHGCRCGLQTLAFHIV